jgi:hypothetical protein
MLLVHQYQKARNKELPILFLLIRLNPICATLPLTGGLCDHSLNPTHTFLSWQTCL